MIKLIGSTFSLTLFLIAFSCLMPLSAKAQITADGTTSTIVNQNGNDFIIEQGSRVGDNLFHSFEDFSVPTLGSAVFNNASDIANIFSRVTVSNISNIDGLLGANGTANLYLINPNGIIFGQNARLNLGGSFFASTADSLLFKDNTEFSASNPQAPPLLEVNIPIGLNFRDNPGEIVNRSFTQNSTGDFAGLEVASGQNITLVGGDISFETGRTTARGGKIELGGLSEAGTIRINDDGSLNFTEDIAKADINLNNAANVDVSGTGGGSIIINARNMNLETGDFGRSLIRAGITSDSTSSEAQAGDITINATNNMVVDNSLISSQVASKAFGDAGDITITTGNFTLNNGGQVSTNTLGQGNAGSVNIIVNDTLTIDNADSEGFPSGTSSTVASSKALGNAGSVNIFTGSLYLTNGGFIDASTLGQGNAGSVNIIARDSITIDGEDLSGFTSGVTSQITPTAEGNSGGVTITAGSLALTNGGRIDSSTFGQGNAGSVNIIARDSIIIDGEDSRGFTSGATSTVQSDAKGNSGGVSITTDSLTLTNGGKVTTSTLGEGNAGSVNIIAPDNILIDGESSNGTSSSAFSQIDLDAIGDSGGVTITTGFLYLTNGGVVTASTFGEGDAGSINITARDSITIDGENSLGFPSGITSGFALEAKGKAGDITINTVFLELTNGGRVTTSTFGQGNAGSIEINASDAIIIDGEQSGGFTGGVTSGLASGANGNGGDIIINTNSLSLTNGGQVSAGIRGNGSTGLIEIIAIDTIIIDGQSSVGNPSTVGIQIGSDAIGDAKNMTITTGSLYLTNGGQVSAFTLGQGDAGNITVNARESVTIKGVTIFFRSGLFANAINSNGNGGNVNVFTNQITIDEGGTIEVGNIDSLGTFDPGIGEPGDINIKANSLSLNNEARINAITQSETGDNANINLLIADDIILRNGSFISAQALNNANGGNLTIDTEFIIAFPNQNNDIIANANQGNGGRIEINTQSLFGIEERLSTPPNQTNDIDASTQFGLQQGSVLLNTPNLDPTSGLVELPETVSDPSDQISQNPCEQGVGSEFIITGTGGLPANPNETLNSNRVRVGLVDPVSLAQEEEIGDISAEKATTLEAIPAQGWIFNDEGEVMLTSHKTTDTEIKRSQQRISNSCAAF